VCKVRIEHIHVIEVKDVMWSRRSDAERAM